MIGITANKIPEFDHARFLKFLSVNQTTGCWNWTGGVSKGKRSAGYGLFYFHIPNTRKHLTFKAHRVSYDIFKGITDLTKVIDHECGNKLCCNPDHLREVSRKVNSTENSTSVAFKNKSKKLCIRGHEFTGKEKGRRRCLTCKNLLIKIKENDMTASKKKTTKKVAPKPVAKPTKKPAKKK